MAKRTVQRRPYSPIIFFLATYSLIQLYHVQTQLFYITISFCLLLIGAILSKRLYQKKKEETQYLSKEDFKQLLTFLFKRQGYSVNSVKKQTPIADLILRKKGSKVVVHIMTSHKSISADKITEVKDNRHKLKAQKTIIVSNNNFTEEAKKVAKAYRLTLMDYETVEAMIDAIKAPKRKHRFIVRVRSLLTKPEL